MKQTRHTIPPRSLWFLLSLLAGALGFTWLQQQGWALTYGSPGSDFAASVVTLEEGGYLAAGYTDSFGAGKQDGWVWRLNDDGGVVWQKVYGGAEDDTFAAVVNAAAGGFVAVGTTRSFDVVGQDAWVARLDAQGRSLWQNAYGGTGNETASAIWSPLDGGYWVAGSTSSGSAGGDDGWVWRLDAAGEVIWQMAYGGAAVDTFAAVVGTTDGNFVVAGETWSFGAALSDAWVLKLDREGNVLWQNRYGGALADGARALQPTADGGVVVAGYTDSLGMGGRDAWVWQLDTAGEVVWQFALGDVGTDETHGLLRLPDKGLLVVGATDSFGAGNGDAWAARLDANGQLVWQRAYGGSVAADAANSVALGQAGGTLLAGHTFAFGAGAADAWLLLVDDAGGVADGNLMYASEARETRTTVTGTPTEGSGRQAETAARSLDARAQAVTGTAATLTTTPTPSVALSAGTDTPAAPYLSLGFAAALVAWVGWRLWRGRDRNN